MEIRARATGFGKKAHVADFSMARNGLDHVVNSQRRYGDGRKCLHFDACLPASRDVTDNDHAVADLFEAQVDLHRSQWERMAQWNQPWGLLSASDSGQLRNRQHVALGHLVVAHQPESLSTEGHLKMSVKLLPLFSKIDRSVP